MKIYTSTVENAVEDIADIYSNTYGISEENCPKLKEILKNQFSRLRKNIYLLIETNYVDRIHRDIYYHYYSTKLDNYPRNCIRVSLFNSQITKNIFLRKEKTDEIWKKNDFLGFYVIRPTFPNIIGRNVISPKALESRYNNFRTCTTCFSTTAFGVKFEVIGFPHVSQDSEMITCAEVTIWELMEYFGNKYPEYSIVTPSKIMNTLKNWTYERQLPSKGLSVPSISLALREYGFAPKIFSKEEYKDYDFRKLFSCYVESGIPIVSIIESNDKSNPGFLHAILCTGHENEDFAKCIEFVKKKFEKDTEEVKIFDWDSIDKKFVFIDDNRPVYQVAPFKKPVNYVKRAKIIDFIVPLYTKVYLDAYEVKNFVKHIIKIKEQPFYYLAPDWDDNIVIRTFLTSSRSYRQYIVRNSKIQAELRDIIIHLTLPKFIWVTELSHLKIVENREINGLIILDATEPRNEEYKSLVLITNSTKVSYKENGKVNEIFIGEYENFEYEKGKIQKKGLPLQPFSRFESNIKSFT